MRFHLTAIVAETNMIGPLERAVAALREEGLRVEMTTAHTTELTVNGSIWSALESTDAAIISMINTDQEARLLLERLRANRPWVTLVYNCQPELMTLSRCGEFDADRLNDQGYVQTLARALQRLGSPLPPVAHVIMAASVRAADRIPDNHPDLQGLKTYGTSAQYWANPSPQNLRRMLQFVAGRVASARRDDGGSGLPPVEPPIRYPQVGLWHPELDRPITHLDEYLAWYRSTGRSLDRGTVGVLLFRQFVLSENSEHYRAAISALEARGLGVIAGFASLDNTPLVEDYFNKVGIDLLLNLTGFNLVGSMGRPNPEAAVTLLDQTDVPYIVAAPLLFQSQSEWHANPTGLHPAQVAIQVVTPELEGGIEPRIYGGPAESTVFSPVNEHVERLAKRAARWVSLRRKPISSRRVAITIFSFPPDKGSVGTAAYLDVFQSLFNTLQALKAEGYDVSVPNDAEELRRMLTGEAGSPHERERLPLAARLGTDEYCRLVPEHTRVARLFGPAPGRLDADEEGLAIRGVHLGNVFVGIQPSFGYEGDPMRLLLDPGASPSHSFCAYYAWLQHSFAADLLIHFGTHGALEFMPGKQVGLTPSCYPDALVGDLPHLYVYSANNPSEATIAKRRSGAVIVSHLSPPLSQSGLYKELAALRDGIHEWEERRESGRGAAAAWATLVALAERAAFAQSDWPSHNAEAVVSWLKERLLEVEERLIPIGLHVIGRPLDPENLACYLSAEAHSGRERLGITDLDGWIETLREPCEDDEELNNKGSTDQAPNVHPQADTVIAALAGGGPTAAREALARLGVGEAVQASAEDFQRWLGHLERHRSLLTADGEVKGLLRAASGRYLPPSPGGDPVRRPDSLPTGRNIHALDPYKIPSPVAQAVAQESIDLFLNEYVALHGAYPESVALVLWGTDNIKNQGESVAQALYLLGVRPVEDSLGRMSRLSLIPLQELGRPRIDVVMSVSGIFRDIFGVTADLLQQAVDLAAAADEPDELNYVRRNVSSAAHRLRVDEAQAALRVFSNSAGAYGTGVNHVIDESDWEDQGELAHLFIHRKAYALGRGDGQNAETIFAEALAGVEATLQNVDSSEIGLTDVDHYYEYLGGLNAAVKHVGGRAAAAYITDTLGETPKVRTLTDEVALEVRTKLLNPKWHNALLRHGYQGVHEIANRLDHTFGWSATSDAVPAWVYEAATDTFAGDARMSERLRELNARSFKRMVGRLLEADARGYWRPDPDRRALLSHLFDDLEAAEEELA